MNRPAILYILIVLIGTTLIGSSFVFYNNAPVKEIKTIDCYDELNHKINDLTCELEIKDYNQYLVSGLFIGGVLVIVLNVYLLFTERLG